MRLDPLGAVSLPEFFDLMAALSGGFGGLIVATTSGHGDGNFLPLISLQLALLEGVPFFLVGLNETNGFVVSPR